MSSLRNLATLVALVAVSALSSGDTRGEELSPAPTRAQRGRKGPAQKPAAPKRVLEIVLDEEGLMKPHLVEVAPAAPLEVDFPEAFKAVNCGSCLPDGASPDKDPSTYRLDKSPDKKSFAIKMIKRVGQSFAGYDYSWNDFRTQINVTLKTDQVLHLRVEGVEDALDATPGVVVKLPGQDLLASYIQEQVAQAKQKLEAEYAERVKSGARATFERGLRETHGCEAPDKSVRHDDLICEVKEVCRFAGEIFLRFDLSNRGQAAFSIDDVRVKAKGGGEWAPMPLSEKPNLSQRQVEFDATSHGIAVIPDDKQAPLKRFELSIAEASGREIRCAQVGL